jgi:Flp pilus assembly pilin Flp
MAAMRSLPTSTASTGRAGRAGGRGVLAQPGGEKVTRLACSRFSTPDTLTRVFEAPRHHRNESDAPAHDGDAPRSLRGLAQETEGAVYVEYITLVTLVAIGAAAATVALGVPLLRLFRFIQMVIAVPFP